jgi:AcrR family transcriptional regulator
MPKILTDIENNILSSAEDLFISCGFHQTDMRKIAAHAQIAVGTIYRYYKNKEDLFLHVMAHSWQRTILQIQIIADGSESPDVKLERMLYELSMGMIKRQSTSGLWTEISTMYAVEHQNFLNHAGFTGMHTEISDYFGKVLVEMLPSEHNRDLDSMVMRLGSFAFVMSVDLCMLPEIELQKNLDLIHDLLKTYIQKISSASSH